jgi:hypothetical protein
MKYSIKFDIKIAEIKEKFILYKRKQRTTFHNIDKVIEINMLFL